MINSRWLSPVKHVYLQSTLKFSPSSPQLLVPIRIREYAIEPTDIKNVPNDNATNEENGLSKLREASERVSPTQNPVRRYAPVKRYAAILEQPDSYELQPVMGSKNESDLSHRLHFYTHKHNTHITLSEPNSDAIISVSAGNIGLRKAARGTYDAAYKLTAYVLNQIQNRGLLAKIKTIEVVLRSFGPGRQAVVEALLGNEGRLIRERIIKVADGTRLKFGGNRGRKPRRLG